MAPKADAKSKIPITVVTGFLGKRNWLLRLLRASPGTIAPCPVGAPAALSAEETHARESDLIALGVGQSRTWACARGAD